MDGELVALFTALPVEELQKLVRRKRHDIERKKDELRHLVGERHRDVIEASDAIQEMKFLTVKVSESIITLRNRCTALDVPPQIISMSSESLKIDPSVAAHLKLLLDIPEMIWNFMDNADHVSAVILFFFGRHIAARLQISTHTYSAGIDARVLVKRLWNSLLHMESAVLAACRRRLNAPPSNWRELCSSLVAIILMENMSLCKALDELLEGRMVALRRIFGDKEDLPFSHEGAQSDYSTLPTRRKAVLSCRLLIAALNAPVYLFYQCPDANSVDKNGAVQKELEKLKNWNLQDTKWLPTERLYTYLSDDVRKFSLTDAVLRRRSGSVSANCSSPFTIPNDFGLAVLQERVLPWWTKALDYCRSMLVASLIHATDLTTVLHTRHVVLSLTQSWKHTNGSEDADRALPRSINVDAERLSFEAINALSNGTHVLLQRPVDLWAEVFRDPFLSRITTILNASLDNLFSEWKTLILRLIEHSTDVSLTNGGTNSVAMDHIAWSPLPKLRTDWAKYVWTDSKMDSPHAPALASVAAPRDPTVQSDVCTTANFAHILRPDNVGLIVFCCLTGLPVLPASVEVAATNSVHPHSSPPVHLLVFLQRLISSPVRPFCTGSFQWTAEKHSVFDADPILNQKPISLSHQLSLTSSNLQTLCETLNKRIADLIVQVAQYAGQDWSQIWSVILDSMERLLNRCEQWLSSMGYATKDAGDTSATLSDAISPSAGLLLSRACSAFVDYCPAIGAAIVTAIGVINSDKEFASDSENGTSSGHKFTWSDVNFLRVKWMEKREPLDNLTDRLMLDCLLKETVQGRVLQTFSESIRAAFSLDIFTKDAEQTLDTVPEIDDRSIIACLSDEPEFFNAGLDFATVPFDEIRIQSDTIQAGDVDETIADHSAIAVLRVPSHISLPLHRALLSVVHIMVRLLVHTIPKPESCRTFCLTLCDAFLSEFSSIADQYLSLLHSETLEPNVDTNSGIPDVPNGVIPPRALQLMFDTQFLIKLLISSSRPGQNNVRSDISGSQQNCQLEKEVRAKAKLLLSTFESLIDPFDLEVSTPRLSSAVSVAFNGLAHLYAPLIWPGTNAQIISNKATDATVDTATAESKSAASMFMPLLTGRNRPSFTTLPLSWSTCFDKRRSKTSCSGRTKGINGSEKPLAVSASSVPKSSTTLPSGALLPPSNAGFTHLGSLWFSS